MGGLHRPFMPRKPLDAFQGPDANEQLPGRTCSSRRLPCGERGVWGGAPGFDCERSPLQDIAVPEYQNIKSGDHTHVLGVDGFDEDDLYAALDWLASQQERIERELYQAYVKQQGQPPVLVLYDVTSSYFEGECNELGRYGVTSQKARACMRWDGCWNDVVTRRAPA